MKYPPTYEEFPLPLEYQGKTRETYGGLLESDCFLLVTSDRISTHNVVHRSKVPNKGYVLNALTIFWLRRILHDLPNHLIAWGNDIFDYLPGDHAKYPKDLHLRGVVVRKLNIVPVEFIWRAYLAKAGSLYRDYYAKGLADPYGLNLPSGLPVMHRFPAPIFTPTDKSATDDPRLSVATQMQYASESALSLSAFERVRAWSNQRGIEIIDSKFEIGQHNRDVFLADEIGTPDSSRYARLADIKGGEDPPWYDKQLARDQAEREWRGSKGPALLFPPEIVEQVSKKYLDLFRILAETDLRRFQTEVLS